MKRAEIFYFSLTDEMTRDEKLAWFAGTPFDRIPFDRITPDKKYNWVNLTDNDFDELLPLIDKEVKAGRSKEAIFELFSAGVKTQRDEWVYDLSRKNLEKKVRHMVKAYMHRLKTGDRLELDMKWDRETEKYLDRKISKSFSRSSIYKGLIRPFSKNKLYFDKHFNGMVYRMFDVFPLPDRENHLISVTNHTQIPFLVQATDCLPSLDVGGRPTQNLPLYRYDSEGNRHDNITDWGLQQIQTHYNDRTITKPHIFHYTYAVLHHPAYRQKYEINLKRDFPRLPLYPDFHQWASWGEKLMDWHINYETIEPYGLQRQDIDYGKKRKPPKENQPKPKLKADKNSGQIILDTETTLTGVPEIAWSYKLGNRSAIEWVLDQHKEKKPKDPTIRELFDTYRFADYKEKVIDLLDRVCTVSIRTMELIAQMPDAMPDRNP